MGQAWSWYRSLGLVESSRRTFGRSLRWDSLGPRTYVLIKLVLYKVQNIIDVSFLSYFQTSSYLQCELLHVQGVVDEMKNLFVRKNGILHPEF